MEENTGSNFFVLIRGDLSLLAFPFFASLESPLWEDTVGLNVPLVNPALICPLQLLCVPEFSVQEKSNSCLYSAVENHISCLKRNTPFSSLS